MLQIRRLDTSTSADHESTQDDGAVLIFLEDVVRVCFLDTTRSKQPVSEVVSVELLADPRDGFCG